MLLCAAAFERLVTPQTRLRIEDGRIRLPGQPGLGVELDDEAIARWRAG